MEAKKLAKTEESQLATLVRSPPRNAEREKSVNDIGLEMAELPTMKKKRPRKTITVTPARNMTIIEEVENSSQSSDESEQSDSSNSFGDDFESDDQKSPEVEVSEVLKMQR